MAHYSSHKPQSIGGLTEQKPLLTSVDSPTLDHAVSQKISTGSAQANHYSDRHTTLQKGDTGSKTNEHLLSSNQRGSDVQCARSRKDSGLTGNVPGSLLCGSAVGSQSPLLVSKKSSQRQERAEEGHVSDVDSSMERYKARKNRNYERKVQRMETSRSRVSTELNKRTDRQTVDANLPREADRTGMQTTVQSEDLDQKFTQPTEVDGQCKSFQNRPEMNQINPDEFQAQNFEQDANVEETSKALQYQTVNSRDYMLTNSVAQVDDGLRKSKHKTAESEVHQAKAMDERGSSLHHVGTSHEKPSASVPNSDQKIPLSGLTSSIPFTDLELSAQSRLMNTQQTGKAIPNCPQKDMQPADDQNYIDQDAALDFFNMEQNALQSNLGATSTLKDEAENLQFIQLNMPQHEDGNEANAAYGYGGGAFEGTMGLPSGFSRQASNSVLRDGHMGEGPIQMSTGLVPGGLSTTMRTDDRAPSSMCNDGHMVHDSREICYNEQTMKINENSLGGPYEIGAAGGPLIVHERHKNITEYTDAQSSIQAQLQSHELLRANTSRQEARYVNGSEVHRPSTILQVSEGLQVLNTWESQGSGAGGLKPSKAYPSHHAIINQEVSQGLFANIQGGSEASGTMTPQYPQTGTAGARSLQCPRSSERGQNSRKHSRASSNGGSCGYQGLKPMVEGPRLGQDPSYTTGQRHCESYYVTLDADNPNRKSHEYRSYVQTNQPHQELIAQQQPPNFQVICFIGAKPDSGAELAGLDSKRPSRAMTVMSSSSRVSQAHSRRPTTTSLGIGGGLLQRSGNIRFSRNSGNQFQNTDTFANPKEPHTKNRSGRANLFSGPQTAKASQERLKPPAGTFSRRNTLHGSQREQHDRFLNSQRSKSQQSNGVHSTQPYSDHQTKKQRTQGRFFTTTNEISSVIFKQNGKVKNFIKPQLRQVLLSDQTDIEKFIVAATRRIKTKSSKAALNLRQYQFDLCLNSEQHTASSIIVTKEFLAKKMIMGQQRHVGANSVVILFGSEHTLKSRDMSPTSPDSYMKKLFDMLSERNEAISVVRAHMYLQERVIDLLSSPDQAPRQREQGAKSDYKRAKQQVIQALQTRSQVLREMRGLDSYTALLARTCSHVVVQINNYYIVELGDLEGLAYTSHPDIIRCLADDFGSMTNEILRQSLFYQDYEFYLSPAQKLSQLNHLFRQIMTRSTKISLFTYLSAQRRHEHCSLTALDFAHKLRQYFYGSHDFCRIPQILQAFSEGPLSHLAEPLKSAFQILDGVLDKVDGVQQRIEDVCRQVQRLREVVLSRKRLTELLMQKESIVRDARAAVREIGTKVSEVEAMRVNGHEPVISIGKLDLFRQIVSDKVLEIQSTTLEVENILNIKSSGRNETATIFTTFGDEDTIGEPSVEGRQPQAEIEQRKRQPQRPSDPRTFNSQDLRQDLRLAVQQKIKHSNSASFLHNCTTESIDNDEEKLDCNQEEGQLLGPYLESSLTPDNRMEGTPFSPNMQHFQSFDCNSKDFYLLNESVHRGMFTELVSHSTQRVQNVNGGAIQNGLGKTEQMQNYRVPPPMNALRRAKQKEPIAQAKKFPPPMVMPARKVRSTARLGGRKSSIIHQPLAVKKPKRKKIVLNTMSVGRPTFSSQQRLLQRQRENNGSWLTSSPHPPSFGGNRAQSQSVTSRSKARAADDGRLAYSRSRQMSKKKPVSASRSAKFASSNKRTHPRRLQIMPISRGSQASCRRVINITIDPDHARDHFSSHSPVPPSKQFYPLHPQHTSSLAQVQQAPPTQSNPVMATTSPHADLAASRPVQTFATFPSHDQLLPQNTSYLLSMNYSQTSASGATPVNGKLAQVETVRRGRTMTGGGNSAYQEKQGDGMYRSYQVKEDYQTQGQTISANESGKRQARMVQGGSSRSKSNCEANKTQPPAGGQLSQALSAHSKNSKSAEAMPNIIHMMNQKTPPLSTQRVSNSQDLQEVLLAEEIIRNKLGPELDQHREQPAEGIRPFRSNVIRLETEPSCHLKQAQSQDAFNVLHTAFNDISTNAKGTRTVGEAVRTLDPKTQILGSDLSVQHERQDGQQPPKSKHFPRQSLLDFVACENQLLNEHGQQPQKSETSNAHLAQLQQENQCLRQLLQSLQEENQVLRGNQEHLAVENNINKEMAENERIKEKLLIKYQRKLSKAKLRIKELRTEIEAQKRYLKSQQEVDVAKQQFKALKDQMQNRIQFLQQKLNQAERLNGELSNQSKKVLQELEQAKKELKVVKAKNQQYVQNKMENEGRDERIAEIKYECQRMETAMKDKDTHIKKLKSRISTLEQELATAQQKRSRSRNATPDGERRVKKKDNDANRRGSRDHKDQQPTEKEERLQRKLTLMKKRFVELEGDIEGRDAKIDQVSKARDKYREQVLVLKQEIKVLKKEQGHEMSSITLTEDSILATNRDDKNNEVGSKFEQLLMAQNMRRKNQALQDMNKYLRDLSPEDMQSQSQYSQAHEDEQMLQEELKRGMNEAARNQGKSVQLRSRELDSSSHRTESIPNESHYNIDHRNKGIVSETPQPRLAKNAKMKEQRRQLSRKSTEAVARKEEEPSYNQQSRDWRREGHGSRMRRDSQRPKAGVVFESQESIIDESQVVPFAMGRAAHENGLFRAARRSSDLWHGKGMGTPADGRHHQDLASKPEYSLQNYDRKSSKRGTAQRTRIDSGSSQESSLSDDDDLDDQQSFFHEHSIPMDDTADLIRRSFINRQKVNKTVLEQQERSMLISKKIVDRVTERIMAKFANTEGAASSFDQRTFNNLVPHSQEDLTSSVPSHTNSMSQIQRYAPQDHFMRQGSASNLGILGPQSTIDSFPQKSMDPLQWAELDRPNKKRI